jgi:subtilase family serine protease
MRVAALSTVLVLAFAAQLRAAAPYRLGGTVPHALAQVAPETAAAADLRLEHVTFLLGLRNRREVEARIAAQQDSRSPFYGRWLGPDEIADRYGPHKAEYGRLRRWLRLHGFTVVRESPFRVALVVAGTAAQVERALKAPIALYRRNGKLQHAPTVDPALPGELAASVQGILGLDDLDRFRPLAQLSLCKNGSNDGQRCADDGECPGGQCGAANALAPADFSAAYSVTPLQSQGLTGAGRSIAVVARSNFLDSDVAAFSQRFLPGLLLTPRRAFAGPDPGVLTDRDERIEVLLDAQWAGALAPGARVNVVISTREGNIPEALVKAVDERLGDAITVSFGLCEAAWQSSTTELFDAFYAIANLQGQTVLVASGDSGAFDCTPDSPIVSVNALASSPHAVAVGGSSFQLVGDGSVPATMDEATWDDALGAGGGGRSAIFGLPPYQRAVGLISLSTGRAMPDLSLAASPFSPGYFMVESGIDRKVGGTSASAPALASVLALVNERLGTQGLGQFLPSLYRLGGEQARGGPVVFRDITQGSNGFPAGPGFDLATGWGAPLIDALAANLQAGRPCDTTIDCLVPARGSAREACAGQWLVEHRALATDRRGLPLVVQSCRDGDVACDADGAADGSCTINVALCLNVFDFRRLVRRGQLVVPRCSPGRVRRVHLVAPRVSRTNTQQNENRDAVATAIASLPDLPTGFVSACSATVPVVVPLPGPGSKGRLTIRTRVIGSHSTTAKVTLRCTAQ